MAALKNLDGTTLTSKVAVTDCVTEPEAGTVFGSMSNALGAAALK